jgi:hypothetical protein
VISWSLRSISRVKSLPELGKQDISGYRIEQDGRAVNLGMDKAWGPTFEVRGNFARVVAKIRDVA